jgi:hypothetical protein
MLGYIDRSSGIKKWKDKSDSFKIENCVLTSGGGYELHFIGCLHHRDQDRAFSQTDNRCQALSELHGRLTATATQPNDRRPSSLGPPRRHSPHRDNRQPRAERTAYPENAAARTRTRSGPGSPTHRPAQLLPRSRAFSCFSIPLLSAPSPAPLGRCLECRGDCEAGLCRYRRSSLQEFLNFSSQ